MASDARHPKNLSRPPSSPTRGATSARTLPADFQDEKAVPDGGLRARAPGQLAARQGTERLRAGWIVDGREDPATPRRAVHAPRFSRLGVRPRSDSGRALLDPVAGGAAFVPTRLPAVPRACLRASVAAQIIFGRFFRAAAPSSAQADERHRVPRTRRSWPPRRPRPGLLFRSARRLEPLLLLVRARI